MCAAILVADRDWPVSTHIRDIPHFRQFSSHVNFRTSGVCALSFACPTDIMAVRHWDQLNTEQHGSRQMCVRFYRTMLTENKSSRPQGRFSGRLRYSYLEPTITRVRRLICFLFFFRGNLHFVVPFRRFPREIIRFTFPRRKPAATDFHYPALIRCKRWLSCAKLCQDNVGSSCRGIVSARRPVAYGASAVCVCVYVCLFACFRCKLEAVVHARYYCGRPCQGKWSTYLREAVTHKV